MRSSSSAAGRSVPQDAERRRGPKRLPFRERLLKSIRRDEPSGCWLWIAAKNGHGYGLSYIRADGKRVSQHAHRAAWLAWRGPIPEGLFVLHRCDTPACVNPDHLFLGTQQDNVADMVTKGRAQRGAKNGMAVLTEADAARIKRRIAAGENHANIARAEGVSRPLVSMIASGKRWRHVR